MNGKTKVGAGMGKRRGLLIGIDSYDLLVESKVARRLEGCLIDVERMRQLLTDRGFNDLRILTDDTPLEPTRNNILQVMEALYLDIVAELPEDGTADDADLVVFYFAGHGSSVQSQEVEGSQRLGHSFQTLVSSDSGRAAFREGLVSHPNRDIFDFEIDAWVRRLNALDPAPQVTLIFDCCHSAGLSSDRRGEEVEGLQVRFLSPDNRPLEALGLADDLRAALPSADPAGGGSGSITRGRGAAGWLRGGSQEALVLAACHNDELAVGNRRVGGFFTFALGKALERHLGTPRWSELFDPRDRSTLKAWVEQGLVDEDFLPIHDKVQGLDIHQHPVRYGDGPALDIAPRNALDFEDSYPPVTVVPLQRYAAVIGIADYGGSWRDLQTARRDAETMAEVLRNEQGYEVIPAPSGRLALTDEEATLDGIIDHLNALRQTVENRPDSAAVIYFAGHGAARPHAEERRVQGFLIPHGADLDAETTWLPMARLRQMLAGQRRLAGTAAGVSPLASRHLLLVLDCCFAGTVSFDFTRGPRRRRRIFASEFQRFVEGRAWQVLTSAAFNQTALDVVRDPRSPLDAGQRHSPFAGALIEALTTEHADARDGRGRRDRIVTVGELHHYLDQRLKPFDFQNPGLAPLSSSNTGQFIFQVPGWEPVAEPDPPWIAANNPWPGTAAYGDPANGASALFYGRRGDVLQLVHRLWNAPQDMFALSGASGSGKTSLLAAGLFPILQDLDDHRRELRQGFASIPGTRLILSPPALLALRAWARDLGLAEQLDDAETLSQTIQNWLATQRLPALDHSLADVTHQLSPSVWELAPDDDDSLQTWIVESRLPELVRQPILLRFHLRFWLTEPGLADLLIADGENGTTGSPTRALPWAIHTLQGRDLVDGGTVADVLKRRLAEWTSADATGDANSDEPSPSRRLLVVDHCRSLLLDSDARRPLLASLSDLADGTSGQGAPSWKVIVVLDEDVVARSRFDAVLGADLQAWLPELVTHFDTPRADGLFDLSPVIPMTSPSHEGLRDVIEEPMLDRALLMDSKLIDRIVEQVRDTPQPLALLCECLHQMYLFRRHDYDRRLDDRDFNGVGEAWGPLNERLRGLYDNPPMVTPGVTGEDPPGAHPSGDLEAGEGLYIFRLLRRLLIASPRPMDHRELDYDGAPPQRQAGWFERALERRLVVSDHRGIVLGHPHLTTHWPAFQAWRSDSPLTPLEGYLPALAAAALHWHGQAQDGLLWNDHPSLMDLVELLDELPVVERRFLAASHDLWRAQLARRLAGEALRAPHTRWHLSLLLAAEAVDLSLADRAERSRHVATESLRQVLALSPLSLSLSLSGKAKGLDFDDDGRTIFLATGPTRRRGTSDTFTAPGYVVDLDTWSAEYRTVERPSQAVDEIDADGAARPSLSPRDADGSRYPVIDPFSGRVEVVDERRPRDRTQLHGLESPPRYLRWSPEGQWLAAAANIESYRTLSPDDVMTLRLWQLVPTAADGTPGVAAREPRQAVLGAAPRHFEGILFSPDDRWLVTLDEGGRTTFFDARSVIPRPVPSQRWLDAVPPQAYAAWGARSWPDPNGDPSTPLQMSLWAARPGDDDRQWTTIFRWPLDPSIEPLTFELRASIQHMSLSRTGRFVLGESVGGWHLWSTEEGRRLTRFPRSSVVDISPDETTLVVASTEQLQLFDLNALDEPRSQQDLDSPFFPESVEFAADGRWVLLRSGTSRPHQLWRLDADGHLAPDASHLQLEGSHLALDPSGSRLALAKAGSVKCLSLNSRPDSPSEAAAHGELPCHPSALAFSPRGDRLAIGSIDGSVMLLDAADLSRVEQIRRGDDNPQSQGVHQLAFSHDGERLAVALGEAHDPSDGPDLESLMFAEQPPQPPPLLVLYDLSPRRLARLARACAGRSIDSQEWQRYAPSSGPSPDRSRAELKADLEHLHGLLTADP